MDFHQKLFEKELKSETARQKIGLQRLGKERDKWTLSKILVIENVDGLFTPSGNRDERPRPDMIGNCCEWPIPC